MNNQPTCFINKNFETIPFVEIILPYTECFLEDLKLELSDDVKEKLHLELLKELSTLSEIVLQESLDSFVQEGNAGIEVFTVKMKQSVAIDFPVLDHLLKQKTANFSRHISKILDRFNSDYENMKAIFKINDAKIVDIDASLGDGHNGEGTALIYLSDETKLIYKPRNINLTNSYNIFINWINQKLKLDLKTFQALDCGEYGWLEFVNNEEIISENDLEEYYHKAGVLLAAVYLLGSKDCHRENVIASGKNPVIIDHETIIQPFLSNRLINNSWDDQCKIPNLSVLENALIVNDDTGVPIHFAGYGVRNNLQLTELEKRIINPNTINSKRVTRFLFTKIVENNVPQFKGDYIFPTNYKKSFLEGFSVAYDLFSNYKEELKSFNSPLAAFKNQEVRYIWRPTFIYFKILKFMRTAALMSSLEVYNAKLGELLSKAYIGQNMETYNFIYDFELKQMINGDIPIFSLNSRDHSLNCNESLKIFEFDCIENIERRIDAISPEHKSEQLEFINRWINIKGN
ncbi:type 2 lanthipeptide synthetase LanM [Flavobacterium defluvii]|uniref:Type 2 lantibiotic biosynthesis protein LanM n=1 Tax=Flavobacterium defluvii TaxID=370979 RepID=A0A1M5VPF5_9FLAO|nr:type 2 lanthipeptide synthetase LanM [Flavobacterium defluvii]SHH77132.1 type 2 lantibiotic biosynthesis protein LanM [Flavobacterium defluvii]